MKNGGGRVRIYVGELRTAGTIAHLPDVSDGDACNAATLPNHSKPYFGYSYSAVE
jgi:hypothetical protein